MLADIPSNNINSIIGFAYIGSPVLYDGTVTVGDSTYGKITTFDPDSTKLFGFPIIFIIIILFIIAAVFVVIIAIYI